MSCDDVNELGGMTGSNPSSIIRGPVDRSQRHPLWITASTHPDSVPRIHGHLFICCLEVCWTGERRYASHALRRYHRMWMIRSCSSRNAAEGQFVPGVWNRTRGWRDIILVWCASLGWGLFRPVRPPGADLVGSLLVA